MFRVRSVGFWKALAPVFRGSVAVGLIAAVAYWLHLNSAATGFVFLIAVVLNGLECGRLGAVIVSVVAVGLLNYFFIEPRFSFRVADPVDIAALAAFLTASLATTLLASRARSEARTALRDRRNLQLLYDCSQRLLLLDAHRTEPLKVLETMQRVLGLNAACYFDGENTDLFVSGDLRCGLAEKTRDAYIMRRDWDDPHSMSAFRQLWSRGKVIGVIGFQGMKQREILAGPAATLAATALERSRVCRKAMSAEDTARTETLRTAILDALAHEFKTPLATIMTAAGGLSAVGQLAGPQAELAAMIEAETERLGQLCSRLLRLARIDGDDVRPRPEAFDIEAEVKSAVDRYAGDFPDRQVEFVNESAPDEVFADAELFHLALSQLLDNACKYSPSESKVEVRLESDGRLFSVSVSSQGSAIPQDERGLIFERFFRGSSARALAGTGLGLYVARKIALAHGGSLDLAPPGSTPGLVAFRLAFPIQGGRCASAA